MESGRVIVSAPACATAAHRAASARALASIPIREPAVIAEPQLFFRGSERYTMNGTALSKIQTGTYRRKAAVKIDSSRERGHAPPRIRLMARRTRAALLWCAAAAAVARTSPTGPRVALIMSGGGIRGLAQVGVVRAFEEAGIRPDLVVGTSMGAIVASLYCAGYPADSIEAIAKSVDWNELFSNSAQRRQMLVSQKSEPVDYLFEMRFKEDLTPVLPKSLSYGQACYDLLSPRLAPALFHAAGDFDSLAIPIRVVATDIVSGQRVVFSRGSLATAVRASCGVPIAFSPVAIDTMLLLDGGLSANIPVEPALEMGARYIIAVDVTSPMWKRGDIDNPVRLYDQIVAIGIAKQKEIERKLADVVIIPDLAGYRNTDFTAIDSVIERGYEAAREDIGRIREDLARLDAKPSLSHVPARGLPLPMHFEVEHQALAGALDSVGRMLSAGNDTTVPEDTLRRHLESVFDSRGFPFARATLSASGNPGTIARIDPGRITDVRVEGNERTSSRLILSAADIHTGDVMRAGMIDRAIARLYATDLFSNVNVDVDSGMIVGISVNEKHYLRARIGLRFDEYHLGEGYVQPAYENLFGSGVTALLHIQYGLRREKYAFTLQGSQLFSSKLANSIQVQTYVSRETISKDTTWEEVDPLDSTLIETRVRRSELTLRKAGVLGRLGTQIGRVAMLDGGIRIERFRVTRSADGVFDSDPLGASFKKGIRYLMVRLTVDNLDRFPFPKKGRKHYISIGGASDAIGGTESFVNVNGSFCHFFTVAERHTIAPQARFAWANKALEDIERVYLGGALPEEKYRDIGVYNYIPFMGLRPRAISGDIMALLHATYRFRIARNLYLSASMDWGDTWERDAFALSRSVAEEFVELAPAGFGLGLAYASAVGPIRVTWGRLLHGTLRHHQGSEGSAGRNVIYFSAGHDF
ncbi:MAG: BamA/TamA family outer membrane protein [Chitinivibrionales bacterium]|nr:BamA/TamA family outer membrane protein [Chitinivibrionales bacterium]MBD3396354.1 BamA/TamA family outer membrane protein [Chitinivibrionales bacterium]